MAEFDFRIAMVGPSRVGKTSLITTLLSQAEDLLAGSPVSLRAADAPTEERITGNLDDLKACLLKSQFNAATLPGTQNTVEFNLNMGVGKSKVCFKVLDFPGAWLRPKDRAAAGWQHYQDWLTKSSVLIVPIDATIVMEAMTTHSEIKNAIKNLCISKVAEIACDWAKEREMIKSPSLLILAPVKCESYFPDNSGIRDASKNLYDAVMNEHLYGGIISAVKKEMLQTPLRVEYHPVGTIGCIDFSHGEFLQDDTFSASYVKRVGASFKPYGADGLLISIIKHAAMDAQENNPDDIFSRFWRFLSGEDKALREAIQKLAQTPFHDRVNIIKEL
jgi:hypothetical protein